MKNLGEKSRYIEEMKEFGGFGFFFASRVDSECAKNGCDSDLRQVAPISVCV
jgi:hypothetical protein